jgi:hypothetical protein
MHASIHRRGRELRVSGARTEADQKQADYKKTAQPGSPLPIDQGDQVHSIHLSCDNGEALSKSSNRVGKPTGTVNEIISQVRKHFY